MKKNKKYVFCLAAVMAAEMIFGASDAMAFAAGEYHIADLKAAQDASQLILVVGDGSRSGVTVSYYIRADENAEGPSYVDGWERIFETEGVYGRNGGSADKKEGDGTTPLGVYHLTMAFGIKENPGSVLPYHQIEEGDFWVTDSASSFYNQLVNVREQGQDFLTGEDMAAEEPHYNYGLVLDYNQEGIPEVGSGIFLHCEGPDTAAASAGSYVRKEIGPGVEPDSEEGSAGCIRIPEAFVKRLIQSVDAETKMIIVSEASQLEYEE